MSLAYAVVTSVLDEGDNLRRLAASLRSQTVTPAAWVIVETGSRDSTAVVARELAGQEPWISVAEGMERHLRGGRNSYASLKAAAITVQAFQAGAAKLADPVDVIVKADADISLPSGYFEELLRRFAAEPRLGIASGTCLEQEGGQWRTRHVTGSSVWGACRAYRAACLADVSPLEERMGWDGIDTFKANARGWLTTSFSDLTFRHHRKEGERAGLWDAWAARGFAAHYMGYRPSFLIVRTLHHVFREPAALAMLAGWARATLAREGRCNDLVARAELRRRQRLRELPLRVQEAVGRRPDRLSA